MCTEEKIDRLRGKPHNLISVLLTNKTIWSGAKRQEMLWREQEQDL